MEQKVSNGRSFYDLKQADVKNIYMLLQNKQPIALSINFVYKFNRLFSTLTVYCNDKAYNISESLVLPADCYIVDEEEKAMLRLLSKFLTLLYAVEVGLTADGDLFKHNTIVTTMLRQNGYLAKASSGGVVVNTLEELNKVGYIFGYVILPQTDMSNYRSELKAALMNTASAYNYELVSPIFIFSIQRV